MSNTVSVNIYFWMCKVCIYYVHNVNAYTFLKCEYEGTESVMTHEFNIIMFNILIYYIIQKVHHGYINMHVRNVETESECSKYV